MRVENLVKYLGIALGLLSQSPHVEQSRLVSLVSVYTAKDWQPCGESFHITLRIIIPHRLSCYTSGS